MAKIKKTKDATATVAGIPSIVDPAKNTLIERGRVKTTTDVQAIWKVLFEEDKASSLQRARYQELLDGKPPLSAAMLQQSGASGATNVNWNLARQGQEEAELPYNDVLESMDVLCSVPTGYGDETERAWIEPKLAEGFTLFLRKWARFDFNWQLNAHIFVAEGLSFAFFEDERDWRYKIRGQQHFKFPRGTLADVSELDVVACEVATQPHQLWQAINRPNAEKSGWSIAAVKQMLLEECKVEGVPADNFEQLQSMWKNNDMTFGVRAKKPKLIHMWVQELDGTVTRLISRATGAGDILYKSEGRLQGMNECLVAFAYNVGTNGEFHSIRGYGAAAFPAACAINRVVCKLIDQAVFSSTPHLKSDNEDGIVDLEIKTIGPYAVLDSNTSPVEVKTPDFGTNLIPLTQMLQGFLGARTVSYTQGMPNQIDRTQRTATEQKMRYAQQGKVAAGPLNLFFQSQERLLKEVLRRWKRKNYQQNEPGGDLVWEFRNWCVKQGIPLEAIYQIDVDSVQINTGFGKGSAQERFTSLEAISPLKGEMDAFAKNEYNRMVTQAHLGNRIGTMLFPQQPNLRPPEQANYAQLENQIMVLSGQPLEAKGNQDAHVHLLEHLPAIDAINAKIQSGELQMAEAIPQMKPLWLHSEMHFEMLPQNNPDYGPIKQALSQIKEVVVNEEKKLNADAQRAQAAGQEGGGNDRTANDLIQSVQASASIDKLQREADFDAAKKQREIDHLDSKLAYKDREAAQKIAFDAAKQTVALRNTAIKPRK